MIWSFSHVQTVFVQILCLGYAVDPIPTSYDDVQDLIIAWYGYNCMIDCLYILLPFIFSIKKNYLIKNKKQKM